MKIMKKITYTTLAGPDSTAFIEDEPSSHYRDRKIFEGYDKHTDEPVRVEWRLFRWVQVTGNEGGDNELLPV